ncbi:alpha-amylase family glycosyl hydrolase [Kaarinaea lacus]
MYENFGAVVNGNSVEFKLFFPDTSKDSQQYQNGGLPRITCLQITGDFQSKIGGVDWDHNNAPQMLLSAHPSGLLYSFRIDHLPEGFYQYKYFVSFENGDSRWCTDPCTKYVATEHENAGFVIGGNFATVSPISGRKPFHELIIYEMMIDDFTAQYRGDRAPVDAIWDKLDYLGELGVNAIEFMPWTAWRGGDFSWGYNPFLFFSVENTYIEDPTNPLDRLYRLKRLINELHRRNIQVIMDGVFNHVDAGLKSNRGFPYHWLYQDPHESPFTGGFANAGYFEEFDYNNLCTQQFIFDVCKFWLDEYQIDGIRFDYTLGFYQKGVNDKGITRLVQDLNSHLQAKGRQNVALMLEHLSDNRYEAISVANEVDASGCWYDRFFYDVPMQAIDGNLNTKLMRVLDTNRDFSPGKGPVTYIENHDHSTIVDRAGGRQYWWKAQCPLIALFTTPGAVLIHNGQEFGDQHHLPQDGPDRVIARPLHWEYSEDGSGTWLIELHKRFIQLRKHHPALRDVNFYPRNYDEEQTHFNEHGYGVNISKDIVIYHRWGNAIDGQLERFIVVLNFSAYDQHVDIPLSSNGAWQDLLNGGEQQTDNYRLQNFRVSSNWGNIFYKKGE